MFVVVVVQRGGHIHATLMPTSVTMEIFKSGRLSVLGMETKHVRTEANNIKSLRVPRRDAQSWKQQCD